MSAPSPGSPPSPVCLPIDADFLRDTLLELLVIPSPSGRTDAVMQHVGDLLSATGVDLDLTRGRVGRVGQPDVLGPEASGSEGVEGRHDLIEREAPAAVVGVGRDVPPGAVRTAHQVVIHHGDDDVAEVLAAESAAGLDTLEGHAGFAADVAAVRNDLVDFLVARSRAGDLVAGTSAALTGRCVCSTSGPGSPARCSRTRSCSRSLPRPAGWC